MDDQHTYLGSEEAPLFPATQDEKSAALLSHILTLIAGFVAPLVIYLIKKNESPFVSAHAKESLNFQITVFLVVILLFISVFGILLLWLVGIVALILVIIATIRASDGKLYRYPFTLRLIK